MYSFAIRRMPSGQVALKVEVNKSITKQYEIAK